MSRFLPLAVFASLVSAFTHTEARADEGINVSIAVERVAGFAYAFARPTDSSTAYHGTMFSLAGPAINPVSLPRIGGDVILPLGLTLGAAVGYGGASLTQSENDKDSSISANAWLLSPRVGYLFRVASMLDLWPRAGITLAGASFQEADYQVCDATASSGGVSSTSCSTRPGNSDSAFFTAVSLEMAAALRLTSSFNLLGAVSYDHVFSASASQNDNARSTSTDAHIDGKYLGAQLWFGLGGYVL